MSTLRDLMKQVEPDHQFILSLNPGSFLMGSIATTLELACSCGWKTWRAIGVVEIDDGYSDALNNAWMRRESTEHLLDQELDDYAVLDTIGGCPHG